MWLDLEWTLSPVLTPPSPAAPSTKQVRQIVREVFRTFESGSIQQVIYQMGTRLLAEIAAIAEVHLEANNRTWDTIAEKETRWESTRTPRPPYGCLGLTLEEQASLVHLASLSLSDGESPPTSSTVPRHARARASPSSCTW